MVLVLVAVVVADVDVEDVVLLVVLNVEEVDCDEVDEANVDTEDAVDWVADTLLELLPRLDDVVEVLTCGFEAAKYSAEATMTATRRTATRTCTFETPRFATSTPQDNHVEAYFTLSE